MEKKHATIHISRLHEAVSDLLEFAEWFRIEVDKSKPFLVNIEYSPINGSKRVLEDKLPKYIDPKCRRCGYIMEYDHRLEAWVCKNCGRVVRLRYH